MNKGLEIRNKKLTKNTIKRNTVKEGQEKVCRFITIKYQIIERINGKYKRIGSNTVNGLQIKNRVYMNDGSYKLINGKGVTIKKTFDTIPEWASDELINKYSNFLKQD